MITTHGSRVDLTMEVMCNLCPVSTVRNSIKCLCADYGLTRREFYKIRQEITEGHGVVLVVKDDEVWVEVGSVDKLRSIQDNYAQFLD